MRLRTAAIAGVVGLAGAVGAAVAFLAGNSWFGAGDLWAMAFWSLPLALLVAMSVFGLSARLQTAPDLVRYFALLSVGVAAGVVNTVFAATVLGPWIAAFSFPALWCWVFGGSVSGIAAAYSGARHSWRVAVGLGAAVFAVFLWLNIQWWAPEPMARVVIKRGATQEEVSRVWNEVLGRPTGRPGEHTLLSGITGVSASGLDGGSEVLTVTFSKTIWEGDLTKIIEEVRRSSLVARVDGPME